MGSMPQGGGQAAPGPFTQRQANIAAARADGTFDAKRNAFNAANSGSFMDTQGNIGPKAPPVAGASPAAPPAMGATQPTPQRPGGPKTVSMGGQFGSGKVDPDIMGPRKPATFDGKSRESFFTDAAKRQGVGNAYASAPQKDAMAPMMTKTTEQTIKPDPKMAALGKAVEIANSPETAATMAKAKDILAKKPEPAVTSAPKTTNAAALDTIKANNPFSALSATQKPASTPSNTAPTPKPSPAAPPKPEPGFFAKRIAANPDGIFGKAADVAGKAQNAITEVQNVTGKQIAATAGKVAGSVTAMAEKLAEKNPAGIAARLMGKKPLKVASR